MKRSLRCYVDFNSIHPLHGKFEGPAAFLQEIAREEKHLHYVRELGRTPYQLFNNRALQCVLWFLTVVYQSVIQFFRPYRDTNRSMIRRLRDIPRMIAYGQRLNAAPEMFYMYYLDQGKPSSDRVNRYQQAWEHHYIGRRIARFRNSNVGALDNKDHFAQFCNQHKLPTIPVIDIEQACKEGLNPEDLFAKSVLGYGGMDCILLKYNPSEACWFIDEHRIRTEDLNSVITERLRTSRFILQYRIRNHSSMRWLSENVLTTLRIITAWDPSGNPLALRATIRFPWCASAILDNSTQGGICAPVDPLRGIICGPAVDFETDLSVDHTLDSKKSITGFQLPLWEEVLEVVYRAHRAANNYNFLGWDVAITDLGVLLIECNVWSDISLVEVPQKEPFLTDEVIACYRAEPALQNHLQSLSRRL